MSRKKRSKRRHKSEGPMEAEPMSAEASEPEGAMEDENMEASASSEEPSDPEAAPAASDAEPEGESDEARREIERLEAEKAELKDLLLRKQAEFENFRKRVERERSEVVRYAASALVKEILPVLDNLERAIEASQSGSEDQLREGVAIIHKQFRDILTKTGLVEIETEGKSFDPHVHEAVGRVQSDEHPEGAVVEVFQKGYRFKDRLLRPAMVSVAQSSGGASEAAESGEESEDEVVHRKE